MRQRRGRDHVGGAGADRGGAGHHAPAARSPWRRRSRHAPWPARCGRDRSASVARAAYSASPRPRHCRGRRSPRRRRRAARPGRRSPSSAPPGSGPAPAPWSDGPCQPCSALAASRASDRASFTLCRLPGLRRRTIPSLRQPPKRAAMSSIASSSAMSPGSHRSAACVEDGAADGEALHDRMRRRQAEGGRSAPPPAHPGPAARRRGNVDRWRGSPSRSPPRPPRSPAARASTSRA